MIHNSSPGAQSGERRVQCGREFESSLSFNNRDDDVLPAVLFKYTVERSIVEGVDGRGRDAFGKGSAGIGDGSGGGQVILFQCASQEALYLRVKLKGVGIGDERR